MPLQVSRRVAHVEESARLNANDRQEFCNQANARMLRVIDSHANFVMVNIRKDVGPVIEEFWKRKILVGREFPMKKFLRENWLSNRIFESYDDILDHCCFAWKKLIDMPWKIISIGTRDWAYRS